MVDQLGGLAQGPPVDLCVSPFCWIEGGGGVDYSLSGSTGSFLIALSGAVRVFFPVLFFSLSSFSLIGSCDVL